MSEAASSTILSFTVLILCEFYSIFIFGFEFWCGCNLRVHLSIECPHYTDAVPALSEITEITEGSPLVRGAPYCVFNSMVATAPKLKVEDKDRVNNLRRIKMVQLNIVKLEALLN